MTERSSVPSVGLRPAPPRRARWRTVAAAAGAAAAFLAVAAMLSSGLGIIEMARWAGAQQRAFHSMVGELLAIKNQGPLAAAALIAACLAYGFLHAAIPGHGKFLIAGAGLASQMTALRLVALSVAASLAQAVTAILLVYGSFAILDITAGWAMTATDRVLIPLSYVAILVIGVILLRRAVRGLKAAWQHHAAHLTGAHHHCNHRHGPTVEEASAVRGWRDAVMLIAGIGLRPCTGAVFVLVAAWRMNLLGVGAASAFAMAIGTGAFISLVAVSAATARGATLFAAGMERASIAVPLLQLVAGAAITLIAVAFLVASLIPF